VYQNSGKERYGFEKSKNIQLSSKPSQTKSEKTSNSCSATSGFSALMVSQLYQ
jgi:hypothetical protein